jgi:PPOX class probable FMN-dependent enzyme
MTDDSALSSLDALSARYGEPSGLAKLKAIDRLDSHCRAFIAASPFLVIGTAAANGLADVSPKGDAPGFVQVLDDRTLAIPDRPGNNRIDSLKNIVENPNVGLIFFVPGMNETLRVNGKASIVADADLLARCAVNGKQPLSIVKVSVEQAFLHCAKALIRSKLWDAGRHVDRKSFPSLAQMISDQVGGGFDVKAAEARAEDAYKNKLY